MLSPAAFEIQTRMGIEKVSSMDQRQEDRKDQTADAGGFHPAMATWEPRRLGDVAIDELQKAIDAADYWRNKYDELLKHIEHQSTYCRYLEQQVFGGPAF